ncbi:hypothetical protein [Anaplasma phagocytophilum]|uniref:hypothetical protein n=1 Tax=Anaplasma phagocytophilum TaxID=948 RepID=UPI0007E520C1|nr:hypothetical protein [Anaplasma phagocytophilum]
MNSATAYINLFGAVVHAICRKSLGLFNSIWFIKEEKNTFVDYLPELNAQWHDDSQCCALGGLGASRVYVGHATVPWE